MSKVSPAHFPLQKSAVGYRYRYVSRVEKMEAALLQKDDLIVKGVNALLFSSLSGPDLDFGSFTFLVVVAVAVLAQILGFHA